VKDYEYGNRKGSVRVHTVVLLLLLSLFGYLYCSPMAGCNL